MPQEKKAAIDMDMLGDKSLGEVSAADFLTALNAGGLTLQHLTVWPEKKKIELYIEPENLGRVQLKDVLWESESQRRRLNSRRIQALRTGGIHGIFLTKICSIA